MKRVYKTIIMTLMLGIATGCQDFLDVKPQGYLLEEDMSDPSQIDKLLLAAYAELGNDEINRPLSLWNYGNVRSDDANKGGRGTDDGEPLHFLEIAQNIDVNSWYQGGFWTANYNAISRCNTVIRLLNTVSEDDYPQKKVRLAEARFIRGHFYFIQKIVFKMVPFIDENMTSDDAKKVSNVALTNDQLWQKIVDDFEYGYNNLPESQGEEVGRPDKFAAAAYLAKALLYKAYRQDDMHNVVSKDQTELLRVITLTSEVMGSGYGLEPDFANNFLPGDFENGIESLFAVQYSHDDNTKWGRLNFGNALTTPTSGCDFHKPSQNLVNSFKTVDGLPDFSNYNVVNYAKTDKVDPRLFHTVAIPGNPYKYTSTPYTEDQTRNKAMYGVYSSLKENIDPADAGYVSIGNWFANSKNQIIVRYSDVILMRAEALIETKQHDAARNLINQVRARAKASTGLIAFAIANADIALYPEGTTWTEEYAREALRWERRLEMAMEGSRFFDLVRWGVAEQVMNKYYLEETPRSPYYANARFTKNKNEYVPIPDEQIRLSHRLYVQNYGFK